MLGTSIMATLDSAESSDGKVASEVTKKRKPTGRMKDIMKKLRLSSHVPGPDCMCSRLKCFQTVSEFTRMKLINEFNQMKSYDEQSSFLSGLIAVLPVQKRKKKKVEGSSREKKASYTFRVRVDVDGTIRDIPVCFKAFTSIFGITPKRVQTIQQSLTEKRCSPKDNRGKHTNRPHKMPDQTRDLVKDFINSWISHYSFNDSEKILPENLNLSKLTKMYNEIHQENIVHYDTFRSIFNNEFNIGFPRKDSGTATTLPDSQKIFEPNKEMKKLEFPEIEVKLEDVEDEETAYLMDTDQIGDDMEGNAKVKLECVEDEENELNDEPLQEEPMMEMEEEFEEEEVKLECAVDIEKVKAKEEIYVWSSFDKEQEGSSTGTVKQFKCDICDAMFADSSTYKNHSRIHAGEKLLKCDFCDAMFKHSGNLKSHIRIHTGERPYKCDFCDASFTISGNLKRHNMIHKGEKPYKCEICNAMFTQLVTLKSHIRIHTGEKPYKCDICNARFTKSSSLKTHTRTHTGEKRYTCIICNATFITSSGLKSHIRIHTGEKPYKCDICNSVFTNSSNLKSHIRTHTPFKFDNCVPSAVRQCDIAH